MSTVYSRNKNTETDSERERRGEERGKRKKVKGGRRRKLEMRDGIKMKTGRRVRGKSREIERR